MSDARIEAIRAATAAQVQASRPDNSTWVSANAGSGKTRVLTDRVARLLLHGTPPEKILCLTYTNAAAAEMQNRLFGTLGRWSMLDDGDLTQELAKIDEAPEDLGRARTLFASALETPGGLKIQTIHAFCGEVLRRFPVEARVPPRFQALDEGQAERLRRDTVDAMARDPEDPGFDGVAAYLSSETMLDPMLLDILKHRDAFSAWDPARLKTALGIGDLTIDDIVEGAMAEIKDTLLQELQRLLAVGSGDDKKQAAKLEQCLSLKAPDDKFDLLTQIVMTKKWHTETGIRLSN